ncbi:D-isomer specific 2-hydroxyacid dehydrogenase [Hyaloscypha finlandica]|nr:D-isomer specific 2-hydroxyacid dehydrogenase [Hyaloscypha finlandica]KAH8790968.1 D-isomer specific 2-hydroxyacid dehydrogenase [Hyaloscypha sp. PMI_1271]
MSSASSSEPTPGTASPASSAETGKPAVLLIGAITHVKKEWEECGAFAELKIFTGATRQEFLKACEDGSYSDVVAIYRSNESTSLTGPFDAELVSKLPSSMKYICHNGAGYDNIDVAACTSRNIQVAHTPQAVNAATADIAIFLMLGALRRIHVPYTAIRSSNWRGPSPQLGYDPQQKVLGIVGMGGIGREVAARARAFGMSIQYFNRSKLSPELEKDAKYVSFEELLKSTDVISLNCSLTKETVGLVGKKEFALMKKGVIIVNTARGKLIDEQALVDALEEGKVFSAGLDVYEEEPKVNEGLLNNPNVVLLPHVGTSTWETQRNMELLVLENLESAVKKGLLVTQVPEQISKVKL